MRVLPLLSASCMRHAPSSRPSRHRSHELSRLPIATQECPHSLALLRLRTQGAPRTEWSPARTTRDTYTAGDTSPLQCFDSHLLHGLVYVLDCTS